MQRRWVTVLVIVIIIVGGFGINTIFNHFLYLDDRIGITVSDFSLSNLDGNITTFYESNGKIRIVTWIYTQCLDGCGTLTSDLFALFTSLSNSGYTDEIEFYMIDIDYLFDTKADLSVFASYVTYFLNIPKGFHFLFGNQQQIEDLTHNWNYNIELGDPEGIKPEEVTYFCGGVYHDPENVEVVWLHNLEIYLIDGGNELINLYSGRELPVDELSDEIKSLVS